MSNVSSKYNKIKINKLNMKHLINWIHSAITPYMSLFAISNINCPQWEKEKERMPNEESDEGRGNREEEQNGGWNGDFMIRLVSNNHVHAHTISISITQFPITRALQDAAVNSIIKKQRINMQRTLVVAVFRVFLLRPQSRLWTIEWQLIAPICTHNEYEGASMANKQLLLHSPPLLGLLMLLRLLQLYLYCINAVTECVFV